MNQPATKNYRPDIDGLRAIAVCAVVFYHGGFSAFSGGYVGVDVFFVISGYLITSLILPDIQAGDFQLSAFYERRIRRLFPALFVVLLTSAAAAFFTLMPEELEDFGQSLATTAVFSSNFLFFTEAGYFEAPAELKPLLHTWSLAIEEQYYLLFPAFLLLLRRFAPARYKLWTLTLLIASFGVSIWSAYQAPVAGFYLIHSRAWELMLGAVLAMGILRTSNNPAVNEPLAGIGLLMILLAIFGYDSTTAFPGLAALLPCLGTALIVHSHSTRVSRLLSLKPIVFIGLLSYSLYLWHWPLLAFAKHFLVRNLAAEEVTLLLILSLGLSVLSWRFVERPFRGRSGWLTRHQLFAASAALTAIIIAIGVVYDASKGLPVRLPADVAAIAAIALDKPANRHHCEGIKPEKISYQRLCRISDIPATPTFIVWGDSHAGTLLSAFEAIAAERNINGLNATSNGCPPVLGIHKPARDPEAECVAFNLKVLSLIQAHPEIETIFLASRWSFHAQGTRFLNESAPPLYISLAGENARNPQHNAALFVQAWQSTLDILIKTGRRIVVVGPVPEVGWDVPNVMAKSQLHHRPLNPEIDLGEFLKRNALVLELFERSAVEPTVYFVPLHPAFCNDRTCIVADEHGPLYFDDDHLSSAGAARVKPLLEKAFSGY